MNKWAYGDRTHDYGNMSVVAIAFGRWRNAVAMQGRLSVRRKIRARLLLKAWAKRKRARRDSNPRPVA